jgi:hypothetical protein
MGAMSPRSILRALIPCVFTLAACGGSGSSDGDGDAGGGDPADPRSGTWSYFDGGIAEATCENAEELYRDPNTSFLLTNNGDGTFTVDQGAEEDFTCDVTGDDFDCPQRLFGSEMVEGVDAVLYYEVSIEGTFQSDTQMSGQQTAALSCEGSACALAPQALGTELPCTYTVDFTAEFSG